MSENQFVGDLTEEETKEMDAIMDREHQVRETLRMTVQAAQDKANEQMMLVRTDGAALWRRIGERLGVDVRVEVLEMNRDQGSVVGKIYRKPMPAKKGEADAGEAAA